jgi:hypothetical protein
MQIHSVSHLASVSISTYRPHFIFSPHSVIALGSLVTRRCRARVRGGARHDCLCRRRVAGQLGHHRHVQQHAGQVDARAAAVDCAPRADGRRVGHETVLYRRLCARRVGWCVHSRFSLKSSRLIAFSFFGSYGCPWRSSNRCVDL